MEFFKRDAAPYGFLPKDARASAVDVTGRAGDGSQSEKDERTDERDPYPIKNILGNQARHPPSEPVNEGINQPRYKPSGD